MPRITEFALKLRINSQCLSQSESSNFSQCVIRERILLGKLALQLLMPWVKNHPSSTELRFLNVSSRRDLLRSLALVSRGYTCGFYSHWQLDILKATEVEGSCTYSQVSPILATCCKRFNSMNSATLAQQLCRRTYLWLRACNIMDSQSLQHQIEVSCCQWE